MTVPRMWLGSVLVGMCLTAAACVSEPPVTEVSDATALEIAEEYRVLLTTWYPRVADSLYGGYLSDFTYDWKPEGSQHKMIVTQARHVWTTSKAAQRFPEDSLYLSLARHGFTFLRDFMWDSASGGFHQLVARDGTPLPNDEGNLDKTAYGNAFGIYGLAAYFAASADSAALELAIDAFRWLDRHSHDSGYGGYFQFLQRDGSAYLDGYGGVPPKDQNSSIHLLEAFTELYSVWSDPSLRERLTEMLSVVRDTLVGDKPYLTLFTGRDWTPVSFRDSSDAVLEANTHLDHVSFGHDVETAFLMLEAAEALGMHDDSVTLAVGKRMLDHSIETGWDEQAGGFFDEGYYYAGRPDLVIIRDTKTWWAQAEGLNTLQLFDQLYPDDPHEYGRLFDVMWHYIDTNLIDHEHGGWHHSGLDHLPEAGTAAKSHIWKGAYHTARALDRCSARAFDSHNER